MQLTMQLKPGLTQQYRSLREVITAVVYQYRGGISGVAAHLDMSPSELGRRLNRSKDDPLRNLDVDLLPEIIAATDDYRPIYWLVETFIPNDEQKQRAAVERLQQLLPEIADLVKSATTAPKARR